MSYYLKIKLHIQILLKILLVRLCLVADEAAGRNKIFKVKYFIGALSYGTNTQSDIYVKISYGI